MGGPVLHVQGRVYVTADDIRDDLWVVDGRVTFTRPAAAGSEVETLSGFALPGLVDAHCHVGLEGHGAVSRERAEEHALADRDAGALLLRDAGCPADTRWVQQREDLPRLIRAGKHIARPRRYVPNFAWEIEPDELVAYVRQEAHAGDGWVKLVGDWIDRDTGDLAPLWPVDALTAAIAAAHEEGARVTAHCFGEQSLVDFAAAGTDCIEHAVGLTDETIAGFARQRIAIVPTLVNIANFPKFAAAGEEKFPVYAEHIRSLHARRYETIRAAHEAGIAIYAGTDAGGQLSHGLAAHEIVELTKAGLSTVEAIAAGCWSARPWLGVPGLVEGESADLNVYLDDPLVDVEALTRPHRTVLRGRLVR